jgi:hypothetical protein
MLQEAKYPEISNILQNFQTEHAAKDVREAANGSTCLHNHPVFGVPTLNDHRDSLCLEGNKSRIGKGTNTRSATLLTRSGTRGRSDLLQNIIENILDVR